MGNRLNDPDLRPKPIVLRWIPVSQDPAKGSSAVFALPESFFAFDSGDPEKLVRSL
jgi:hypothetical protein